jgi:hypothetical protein
MVEEGKKRKRSTRSGEAERPAKKVAILSPRTPSPTVKLSVLPKHDTWIPALGKLSMSEPLEQSSMIC